MFYLMTHSTHFIYGYMESDIWLRTILIVREETRCCHIDYPFRLAARFFLYAPSHRQDSTYHGLCYTSHGALAGTRNSSMGPPHEGLIRQPIVPWVNALTMELSWTEVPLQFLPWLKFLPFPLGIILTLKPPSWTDWPNSWADKVSTQNLFFFLFCPVHVLVGVFVVVFSPRIFFFRVFSHFGHFFLFLFWLEL